MFSSVDGFVRTPEDPQFIRHHYSLQSPPTDVIKGTALQETQSHQNQTNSQELQGGQAISFALRTLKTYYKIIT